MEYNPGNRVNERADMNIAHVKFFASGANNGIEEISEIDIGYLWQQFVRPHAALYAASSAHW